MRWLPFPFGWPRRRRIRRHLVLHGRVRPLLVVVGDYLGDDVVHVLLAKHNEVVEALLLQRLDEPLHEGIRVERTVVGLLDYGPADFNTSSNEAVNFVSRFA